MCMDLAVDLLSEMHVRYASKTNHMHVRYPFVRRLGAWRPVAQMEDV